MKRYIIVFAVLGSVLFNQKGRVNAAPLPTPSKQVSERISYQKYVPREAAKLLPRKARTRFVGAFRLRADEPEYLLHIWSRGLGRSQGWNRVNVYAARVLQKTRAGYRLISDIPFVWQAPDGFYATKTKSENFIDAQKWWIDPQQRQKLVISLQCFTRNSYGPIGDNVLLIFAQGLAKPCVVQTLRFGGANGPGFLGHTSESVDLSRVADDGSMKVHIHLDGFTEPADFDLLWNGRRFTTEYPDFYRNFYGQDRPDSTSKWVPTGLSDAEVAPVLSGLPESLALDSSR